MARIVKIAYISGTRADYGLMRRVLIAINSEQQFELIILACGMHLMEAHGNTINEIEKDGLKIHELDTVYDGDERTDMALFVGETIVRITEYFKNNEIDTVILLGDRGEMLAGAISAAYCGKLVIHFHGGDRTSTIDESARHAISKIAHIHLTAIPESAKRLEMMGEDSNHIYIVGSPGLEGITENLLSRQELNERLGLDKYRDITLAIFHPVTEEMGEAGKQMQIMLSSLQELDNSQIVIIEPNSDAGRGEVVQIITEFKSDHPGQYLSFKNLSRELFLSLMNASTFMIGNSSSGIIEAASLKTAVINVGDRQAGRKAGENVIHVQCRHEELHRAIHMVREDNTFKSKISRIENLYGDGKTSEKVINILKKIVINSLVLQKRITY